MGAEHICALSIFQGTGANATVVGPPFLHYVSVLDVPHLMPEPPTSLRHSAPGTGRPTFAAALTGSLAHRLPVWFHQREALVRGVRVEKNEGRAYSLGCVLLPKATCLLRTHYHLLLSFTLSEQGRGKFPGVAHQPLSPRGVCLLAGFLYPCPQLQPSTLLKAPSVTLVRVCHLSPARTGTGKIKTKLISLEFHFWNLHDTMCAQ